MPPKKPVLNFLITGAGRGIGRGLSRLLLDQGHRVFLLDNNTKELNHTAENLSVKHTRGKDFEAKTTNLRKPSEITAAATAASKLFSGKLDVLINNAAYVEAVGKSHLKDLSLEDWTASIETNLTAPMLMSKACLPMLQKSSHGGVILHMSSTRAFMSEPNNEPYSATKAGILGLTQSMAVSLAEQNIRVNAILPGWINVGDECKEADEKDQDWEEGLSRADHKWHLTGRVGKVDDVWRAVMFLVESEFVTGTETVVDGGVTRKMVYPE
jgi:NAD(P)-dependent dehydrogenase (short-subunit alcohol dehydrogenase family)